MENHKGFIVLVDISGYTNFVSGHNIDSSKNDKLSQGQAHAEHVNRIEVYGKSYGN